MRSTRTLVMVATLLAGAAQALPTQEQALALAFPDATVKRVEHFLTEAQKKEVESLAGVPIKTRFVIAYEATKGGARVGVAFFDTHVVRTQPETAMVAVGKDGKVLRVEVVQFREPDEYRAPDAWKKQLEGKSLAPSLSLKGDIHPLSGASLTAQALTDAARRVLALDRVLYGTP